MVNTKRLLSLSAQALLLTKIRVDGPMLFRECVRLPLSLVKKYAAANIFTLKIRKRHIQLGVV